MAHMQDNVAWGVGAGGSQLTEKDWKLFLTWGYL